MGTVCKRWARAQRRNNLLPIEELREVSTPQLECALDELGEIAGKLNMVEMVTAVNHNTERDKWLELARQGKFTTPHLEYNVDLLKDAVAKKTAVEKAAANITAACAGLPATVVGGDLRALANNRVAEVNSMISAADAILRKDALTAGRKMIALYGLPTNVNEVKRIIDAHRNGSPVATAQPIYSTEERDKLARIQLDAEALRKLYVWVARRYGIADSRPVVVSDQATSPDVRDVSSEGPIVVIPADFTLKGTSAAAHVIHEVGCHWRDSENVQRLLPKVGAGALKPVDELLYEGHATWEGRRVNLCVNGQVKLSRAFYYPVAIHYAYHNEALFAETARYLYDFIKSEDVPVEQTLDNVWRVTYRVYRGNPQMERRSGYVYTKDRAYFQGRQLAQELKDAGLGYLLNYGTLAMRDLAILVNHFKMVPQGGFPYPEEPVLYREICTKLLKGESFT